MCAAEVRQGSPKPKKEIPEEKKFEFKPTGMVILDRLFADAEKIVATYPTEGRMLQIAKNYYEAVLAVQITDELRRKCLAEINAINEKLGPQAFYASGLKYAEMNFQNHIKHARQAFVMAKTKAQPDSELFKLCEQNIKHFDELVQEAPPAAAASHEAAAAPPAEPPAAAIKTKAQEEEEVRQQFIKAFNTEIPYEAKLLNKKDAEAERAVADYKEGLRLLKEKDYANARKAFGKAEAYYQSGFFGHKYLSKEEAKDAQNRCDIMIRRCLLEIARAEFKDEKDENKVSLAIGKKYSELVERTKASLVKREGPAKLSLAVVDDKGEDVGFDARSTQNGQLYFVGNYRKESSSPPRGPYNFVYKGQYYDERERTHRDSEDENLDTYKTYKNYRCSRPISIPSLEEMINHDQNALQRNFKSTASRNQSIPLTNTSLRNALESLKAHDIKSFNKYIEEGKRDFLRSLFIWR